MSPSTTATLALSKATLTRLLHALYMANANLTRLSSLMPQLAPTTISTTLNAVAVTLRVAKPNQSNARCARALLRHITDVSAPSRPRSASTASCTLANSTTAASATSSPQTLPEKPTQTAPPATSRRMIVRVTPDNADAAAAVQSNSGHPFLDVTVKPSRPLFHIAAHLFRKWGLPISLWQAGRELPLRTKINDISSTAPRASTTSHNCDSSQCADVLTTFRVVTLEIPDILYAAAHLAGVLRDEKVQAPEMGPDALEDTVSTSPRVGGTRTYPPRPGLSEAVSLSWNEARSKKASATNTRLADMGVPQDSSSESPRQCQQQKRALPPLPPLPPLPQLSPPPAPPALPPLCTEAFSESTDERSHSDASSGSVASHEPNTPLVDAEVDIGPDGEVVLAGWDALAPTKKRGREGGDSGAKARESGCGSAKRRKRKEEKVELDMADRILLEVCSENGGELLSELGSAAAIDQILESTSSLRYDEAGHFLLMTDRGSDENGVNIDGVVDF